MLQTKDIDALLNTNLKTIIAGDFNDKHTSWNSLLNNTASFTLERYTNSRTDIAVVAPTTPTHYPDNPTQRPDLLDLAI